MACMQARAMLDSGLTEEAMVNQEFEELYPGKVQRTQMAYNSQVAHLMFGDLNPQPLHWQTSTLPCTYFRRARLASVT